MPRVTCDVTISLDGFVAGAHPSITDPIGDGGALHRWMFEHAEENADELAAMTSGRAYVMGRNMFGPGRGPWDESWRGWWGEEPPFHAPVFVLTHHPRPPLELEGGTTFTFVTDGPAAALAAARAAAGERDVAIAGGAATINTYLHAGDIDELRLHIAPLTLGGGERLFDAVLGFEAEPLAARATPAVVHVTYGTPPPPD
jgi:dihydrofolate reductase